MLKSNRRVCAFCKQANDLVVECASCNKLLPIGEDEYYFKIFKLDENAFTPEELDSSYYKLSGLYHPDKYISKSSPEQVVAQSNSELINKAYRTLKDDMKKWEYILDKQGAEPHVNPDNMHLLQEVMQWGMRLEEENPKDLQAEFMAKKQFLTKEVGNKIAKALYFEAKKDYITLKYLNRFLVKVDEAISNK